MHQMAQSSVFLSGMGGLGIEIGMLNDNILHNSTVKIFNAKVFTLPTLPIVV